MRTAFYLLLLAAVVLAATGVRGATEEAVATQRFVESLNFIAAQPAVPTVYDIDRCLSSNKSHGNVKCDKNMVKLEIKVGPQNSVALPALPSGTTGSQIKVGKIKLNCKRGTCSGALPPSWMTLSNLQELTFDDFQLSGTLPCDWTQMVSLTKLELEDGYTSGPLPEFPSSMQKLDMGKNSFCGTLPSSWANLPLSSFDMEVRDRSRLCGCAPSWVNKEKLKDEMEDLGFKKSGDGCSTVSPTCDGSCGACGSGGSSSSSSTTEDPTLRFLRLLGKAFRPLYNDWTGDNWGAWPGVVVSSGVSVSLSGTQLRGALPQLPDDLDGSQVRVSSIDLSGSATVVGTLPASWRTLSQLQTLTLSDTLISGTLPAAWSTMANLTTLTVRNTLLCGALPDWFMPSLQTVDLSNNKYLRGSLNPSWASMPKLKQVTLGTNAFCGTVPQQWSRISLASTRSEYLNCSEELNKCNSGSFQLKLVTALAVVTSVFAVTLW